MQQILGIIGVLTDALIICGFVMAIALIALWIWQVARVPPPKE